MIETWIVNIEDADYYGPFNSKEEAEAFRDGLREEEKEARITIERLIVPGE